MNDIDTEYHVPKSELQLRKLDRRDKVMRGIQLFTLGFVVVVTFLSLQQVTQLATDNKENIIEHRQQVDHTVGKLGTETAGLSVANRARNDAMLCIISRAPTVRTAEYVKSCYDLIEEQYEIEVQRFGDGI